MTEVTTTTLHTRDGSSWKVIGESDAIFDEVKLTPISESGKWITLTMVDGRTVRVRKSFVAAVIDGADV